MKNPPVVYPISCQLTNKSGSITVNIVKIGATGILVDSTDAPLLVNSIYTMQFVLPFVKATVETLGVVFKTYDEFKGTHGLVQPGSHVNEIIFKNPTVEVRKSIASFLGYVSSHSKF